MYSLFILCNTFVVTFKTYFIYSYIYLQLTTCPLLRCVLRDERFRNKSRNYKHTKFLFFWAKNHRRRTLNKFLLNRIDLNTHTVQTYEETFIFIYIDYSSLNHPSHIQNFLHNIPRKTLSIP